MKTISEKDFLEKGYLHFKNLIENKDETIHITDSDKPLFVILSEKKYSELLNKVFENETVLSEKQFQDGTFIKGKKEDLFSDLGI